MEKLRSLKAWTSSKEHAKLAYGITLRPPLSRHFALADQIRRAAISVPANIVEGYALGTRPQLIRCLRIAYASACELRWHIEFAGDFELIDSASVPALHRSGETVIKLLTGLIRKLGSHPGR
jgi:four helix bundle protein